jgi:hypothetical protein
MAFCAGLIEGRGKRRQLLWWTGGALGLILLKALLHARPVWEDMRPTGVVLIRR